MRPQRRWKPYVWFTVATVTLGGLIQLAPSLELRPPDLPRLWVRPILVALAAAFWAVALWWLWRSARLGGRGPGHGPEDLGHPHDVELELAYNGERVPLRLVIGEQAIEIAIRDLRRGRLLGSFDPPIPERLALADVRRLKIEPTRLLLDVATVRDLRGPPAAPVGAGREAARAGRGAGPAGRLTPPRAHSPFVRSSQLSMVWRAGLASGLFG